MATNEKTLEGRHQLSVPFSYFQYIDVTFGTANTDVLVEHLLLPTDPEDVNYEVVRADRATSIYHNQAAGRKPWGRGYVVLRSSVADAVVRLRLSLEP